MSNVTRIRQRPAGRPLRSISLCAGIEAWSEAIRQEGLPIELGAYAEIEPGPCAVLAARHPGVPNLGDMTAPDFVDRALPLGPFDVMCAGTPCQAYSIAGRRGGLADARGNLTLTAIDIVERLAIPVYLWENVPGVLSDETNAFGNMLADLCGHDEALTVDGGKWPTFGLAVGPKRQVAWRVMDAQFWGTPQRRRRVFLIAAKNGYGLDAARMLFDFNDGL